MDQKENAPESTHLGDESTPSASGDEAVTVTETNGLTLEDINALTGREYKDLESAKKSIKEWQAEASRAHQKPPEKEPGETNTDYEQRIKQLEVENFFARNQDHEGNRSLLEKIAKADGISLAEAIDSPEYKAIYETQTSVKENQSRRTVVESNNRVTQGTPQEPDPSEFVGNPEAAARYVRQKFFNS